MTLAYQAPLEIAAGGTDIGEITGTGTALGIAVAFGVLAASVGLIRSETAGRQPSAVAMRPMN